MLKKFVKNQKVVAGLLAAFLVSATDLFACQTINGVPDYNCDGQVKITVLGDSLVFGFGDQANKNKGGYVLRASKKLTSIDFVNLGEKGLRAGTLLSRISKDLKTSKDNKYTQAIFNSDVVVLDLGRNDRWLFGEPIATRRDLGKIGSLIKSRSEANGSVAPMVVTAVLMLPNRGSQGPWVAELNKLILASSTDKDPADLRFDKVSKRLLASDNIHPTSKGYVELAKVFLNYLKKPLPKHMKVFRPDSDNDGIFDRFETSMFGTNPELTDTDSDGMSDGQEVFQTLTDPLVANW